MSSETFYEYINDYAPVLFFRLDREGRILSTNRYARQICGDLPTETRFQEILIDFQALFDFKNMTDNPSGKRLFSIKTVSGFPHSYLFVFKNIGEETLAFGHFDLEDIELLRTEVLSLNQELGNLTRSLHKKNAELKYALDHVKTLQGIIPICMHCHKIRDEKQIWDRLEKYLTERTSAELSHSICPECMEKYYPELHDEDF
ncbi:MAG: hypothetical protein JEZ02_05450 [Desulfatibacillum sp.]|nr:hypothetical protein [Desulfatibacillum sp.]